MVPDLLSSNLCSLRGGEERFAFSVIWELTKDAEILDTKFMKSVIRSRVRGFRLFNSLIDIFHRVLMKIVWYSICILKVKIREFFKA